MSERPTTEPRLRHVQCLGAKGLHRMAYWEWGDPAERRVVVCVHGLSRQGRDFDTLAAALSAERRVVCPDIVGRGRSDWLDDPMGYAIPAYVADMVALLARLDAEQVDWVGTSMGGLIGLGVAGLEERRPASESGSESPISTESAPGTVPDPGLVKRSPLRRLVLNDVGPTIDPAGLARIGAYIGQSPRWATEDEAADALLTISQGFGPHTREQWMALTRPQLTRDGDAYVLRCDPKIAVPFRLLTPEIAKAGEAAMWALYDRLRLPVLLLRGAQSDVLSHATAQAMSARGPRARLVEFSGIGHAPMLVQPEQVKAVRDFLLET